MTVKVKYKTKALSVNDYTTKRESRAEVTHIVASSKEKPATPLDTIVVETKTS